MVAEGSFLEAVQWIPGSTPAEKYKWLSNLVRDRIQASGESQDIDFPGVPAALVPLLKAECAKIRKDPTGLCESLKSEDSTVVGRALQTTWLFTGDSSATSVKNFSENLFPVVSARTRAKIFKALATELAGRRPDLAEQFFEYAFEEYGAEQAVPLLAACSEDFVYNTVVERQLVLPARLIKIIYRNNVQLVIRYLKLSKPSSSLQRSVFKVDIHDHADVLKRLVKRNLDGFAEIMEMHENNPPSFVLSNKAATLFLKNGKEHLLKRPKLYMRVLPLKLFDETKIKEVFPKLLPDRRTNFRTDDLLAYLRYYPKEKRAALLMDTYKTVYGKDLLEEPRNATASLMKLLPAETRIRMARIKMQDSDNAYIPKSDYERTWKCYQSAGQVIEHNKQLIAKSSQIDDRMHLLNQMIYSCKVNEDYECLLETLKYINTRHKNEDGYLIRYVADHLVKTFEIAELNEDIWEVLFEMIKRNYVKDVFSAAYSVTIKLLEGAILHKLRRNENIDELIEMLTETMAGRYNGSWNILEKYPELERRCFEECLKVVEKKYEQNTGNWKDPEKKIGVLTDLLESIYKFNDHHKNAKPKVERLSLSTYPWLLNKVKEVVLPKAREHAEEVINVDYTYGVKRMKNIVKENEPVLFDAWFGKKKPVADVLSGTALNLLKKDPKSILANWEDYLKNCSDHYYRRRIWRFLRVCQWYSEIPMRFADNCRKIGLGEKNGSYLFVLAILLDGESYYRAIEPLVPTDTTVDVTGSEASTNYNLSMFLPRSFTVVNPPVPLEAIERYCKGDYLSGVLNALRTVARRMLVPNILPFAERLANQRVSVKKHGMRVICEVAPLKEVCRFLLERFKAETNYSIREIVLRKAFEVFYRDPNSHTWSLIASCLENVSGNDDFSVPFFSKLSKIRDHYIVEFVKLVLRILDRSSEMGLKEVQARMISTDLLHQIDEGTCALLPDELLKNLMRRFVFGPDHECYEAATRFLVDVCLLPATDRLDSTLEIFREVFTDAVRSRWDHQDFTKHVFYPVNYQVRHLISTIARSMRFKRLDTERKIIDSTRETFLSVLRPHMEPESYMQLAFAKERLDSTNPTELGRKIAKRIPEFVEIFSDKLLAYAGLSLRYFLRLETFPDYDDHFRIIIETIEGIVEGGDCDCCLVGAAMLVPTGSKELVDRYNKLVEKFKNHESLAVRTMLYTRLNIVNGVLELFMTF